MEGRSRGFWRWIAGELSRREFEAEVLKGLVDIMANLDDLKNAVATLGTDVDALLAAGSGGTSQADVDAVTAAVDAIDGKVLAAINAAGGGTAAADVTTAAEAGSDGAADNTQAADTTAGADVAPNA